MKPSKAGFLSGWTVRMAWRDSRSSRRRMLLYVATMLLGVAALVAISSFGENLSHAIDEQARSLLGADLSISSSRPFSPEIEEKFAQWEAFQSHEVSLSSMALFPRTDDLRLVQIRAIEGDYPYYGILETEPLDAAGRYREGPYALVDESLMLQFGAQVDDSIKLGNSTFRIAGRLKQIPGESAAVSLAAPRVFISLAYLPDTGLIQLGSRAGYRSFFKFKRETEVERLVENLEPFLKKNRLRTDTVAEEKRNLGRAMENLTRFLSLVGFIALLLGGIGVASAVHLYVKQKLNTVGILRCLGCSSRQTFAIYLLQAAGMGLLGTIGGSLLGISVQALLPQVLGDFIPVEIPFFLSWKAILKGAGTGLGIALLFALVPLLPIRRISPLLVLRSDYEEHVSGRDLASWLVYFAIAFSIFLFAITQSTTWIFGVWFFAGLAIAFGLLAGVAKGLIVFARRLFPTSWSYVWRQGFANLYRPQNQTLTLMLSLGLGTFLIVTLFLVQGTLLSQAALTGSGSNPNLVFFDIQTDQKEAVRNLLTENGAPILQDVPIVTMRLSSIGNRTVEELREDDARTQPRWALGREYRSTYRAKLADTERIVAGKWHGDGAGSSQPVEVSLEKGIAEELGVSVGDKLVFDVQGIPVETLITSLREVDWQRVQPNFFVVFAPGALEKAPQFHVLVTRVNSSEQSAQLQRAVIKDFPNVSTIDLALILNTIDEILGRVSFVIQFMALFSILTGLIVLAGAVISSRYQRIRESVLLRTLGASRAQVLKIMVIEYLFLGSLAALTGLVLALAAGWALAYFLFESSFNPALLPVLAALVSVVVLTILIGVFNSRSVLNRPPLEALRAEI